MFEQILNATLAIVVGVGALLIYYYGTNWLLETLVADQPGEDGTLQSREKDRETIRPWLFVVPALAVLGLYLVYPAILTFFLSFGDSDGNIRFFRDAYSEQIEAIFDETNIRLDSTELEVAKLIEFKAAIESEFPDIAIADVNVEEYSGRNTMGQAISGIMTAAGNPPDREFVLFRNYEWALNNDAFWESIRNNIAWLLVPFVSTALGLLIAVLADGVRWGAIIKSLIFMPMAISFVGASVIWKFVYDLRPEGSNQIGVLNAMVVALGGEPQPWITLEPWNNFLLMVILIWIQTGFAMVLLSAALRGVPEESLEAARIDGASEVQIFFRIMVPQIMSTILVVLTTITIIVLKVFDIVLAMTSGQFGTQVLANLMFDQAFRAFDDGRGSVISVFLMLAVVPILIWNVRQFRRQEMIR